MTGPAGPARAGRAGDVFRDVARHPVGRGLTQDDPSDGPALDDHPLPLGPFAPMLPPGLRLRLTLQGETVRRLEVLAPPAADPAAEAPFRAALGSSGPPAEPRGAASDRPVAAGRRPHTGAPQPPPALALADLERLRAAHHLRCVARLLGVRGLTAPALRALRLAAGLDGGGSARLPGGRPGWSGGRAGAGARASDVAALARRLHLAGRFLGIPPELGRLDDTLWPALAGPALRASGVARDLRAELPAYRRAGFRALVRQGGDVRARLAQWLDEAAQSLALAELFDAEAPDEVPVDAAPADFEAPWGPVASDPAPDPSAFASLLVGRAWSEAVTVIASLDAETLRRLVGPGSTSPPARPEHPQTH